MSRPKVGIFDVDGTIYRDSLNIDLIDRLRAMGALTGERFAKSDRLRRQWKNREGLDAYESFAEALVHVIEKERAFSCRADDVRRVCTDLVDEKGRQVYEFNRELIYALRELEYVLVAVSGSPKPVVDEFVRQFGFHHVRATEYEIVDGAYTGKILSLPVHDKAAAIREVLEQINAAPEDVIAIGDTTSDYSMLASVRYPVAFNPSRKLKQRIRDEGVGIWTRRPGIVTQRKDDISVMRFGNDLSYRPRLEECALDEIFPRDVSELLYKRLGSYLQYP